MCRTTSSSLEADDVTAYGPGTRRRARDVYGRAGLALLALALIGLTLSACGGAGHAGADAVTSSTATTGATTGGESTGTTSTVDPKGGSGGGGTTGANEQSKSSANAGGSSAVTTGTAGTGGGGGSGAGESSKDSAGSHAGGGRGTGAHKKDASGSHGTKGAAGAGKAPAAVTGAGAGGGSPEPDAAQPTYEVRSLNMEPTYKPYVKLHYNPSETTPAVAQVVVFRLPVAAIEGSCGDNPPPGHACQEASSELSSTLTLGRVVAVGGDSVAFQEGNTVLNGSPQAESSFTSPCGSGPVCNFSSPITVPAGDYYILYDNRSQVNDSRVWGAVPQAAIAGVVDGVVSSS
jgi:signal peptidase I